MLNEISKKEFEERYQEVSTYVWKRTAQYIWKTAWF